MKPVAALIALTCLGLSAQVEPGGNRMGIGLSAVSPQGDLGSVFGTGFQGGLQIHFNRESRHLGRLRVDYLRMDSKRPISLGTWAIWNGSAYVPTPQLADSRMEAYSVAYEWMPHLDPEGRSGFYGIFGMGGTLWNETWRNTTIYTGTDTDSELGFTLSAGAGWRFNTHAALEARYVHSDLTFHGHHRYGSERSYLAFGTSLRF
ncbi:MAG: outer membrane protein beta-barrel domain [Holophagaceae bacterium]|nr:outer membrane protein beta-barrel domain [Holophagaceae bacterium]